jgi:hypothetical protein
VVSGQERFGVGEIMIRRQKVIDASVFALITASGIALHALWPSIEGRRSFSDGRGIHLTGVAQLSAFHRQLAAICWREGTYPVGDATGTTARPVALSSLSFQELVITQAFRC